MREAIKNTLRRLLGAENARKLGQAVRPKKVKWSPPPPDGKVRLNLGCGDKILEGYINVDFAESRKGNKPDIIADLRALQFKPDYADEILSVHVIEHFYPWEAEELLSHWKDILKPGGKLVLECPNILTAAAMLLKDPDRAARADGKDGQLAMWPLYGDPAWKDPLMCHRWGYTPTTLIDLLKRCGFSNVRREPAMFKQQDPRDMRVVGEK
jgi:SAM-dependent methyltransferase